MEFSCLDQAEAQGHSHPHSRVDVSARVPDARTLTAFPWPPSARMGKTRPLAQPLAQGTFHKAGPTPESRQLHVGV